MTEQLQYREYAVTLSETPLGWEGQVRAATGGLPELAPQRASVRRATREVALQELRVRIDRALDEALDRPGTANNEDAISAARGRG